MYNKWIVGLVVVLMLLVSVLSVTAQEELVANQFEMTGEIESMDGNMLVISGFTVDASQAEIKIVLDVGLLVKVEGVVLDDGTVEAAEIEAVSTEDLDVNSAIEYELVGTLDSLDADTAVVAGQLFDVTGTSLDDGVAEGELVEVHAVLADDGLSWVVSEISLYVPDMDGDSDDDMDDDSGVCQFEVEVSSANLREGPGTGYDVVGFAYDDETFVVSALDVTGTWAQVAAGDGEAWIAISTGEIEDDCIGLDVSNLPIINDDLDDDSDDDSDDDDYNDDSGDDDYDDDSSDDDYDDDSSDDDYDDDSSDDDYDDDSDDDSSDDDYDDDSSDDNDD